MCGISGVIFNKYSEIYLDQVRRMNQQILHRGPDSNGTFTGDHFVFGHTRLSIIDISDLGHQPMVYQDRYVITYNGEVYNYLEIRDELIKLGYSFKSHSDTEVILASFAEWGENCVSHFNGMFAFAIYDLKEKNVFLARDRTGVKPLYYYQSNDHFYFFSEPKQIINTQIINANPNKNSIYDYLAFQFTLDENTFFEGVKKLLPGHCCTFKNNQLKIKQYWNIDSIEVDNAISKTQAEQDLRDLIEDAIKIRLRSDVKVGSYLSGGIDSSIVSAIAAKNLENLDTFTFTSKKTPLTDESELAQNTSDFLKTNHHEFELEQTDILNLWIKAIYYMDEPEVGYSLLPQMEISKDVSKHLKVVLGGQGGDEIFYGYGWHSELAIHLFSNQFQIPIPKKLKLFSEKFARARVSQKVKFLFELFRIQSLKQKYFRFWTSITLFNFLNKKELENRFKKCLEKNDLISIKKFEYKFWLQALLHVEDRSSMYASLESRVPLLDYRIAEYVFKLNPTYMIDGGLNKKIFIDSFKSFIHPNVINNKIKKGYSAPLNQWLQDNRVVHFLEEMFGNKNSFIYQFISYTPNYKKAFLPRQIWMLASLEIWHSIYISRDLHAHN